jgi:hypothetical protein
MELQHAEPSAAAVATRLHYLGYAVVQVCNCALADMHAAFDKFKEAGSPGCSAVIYFCGHGLQDYGSRDCLLVPVDFPGEDAAGTTVRPRSRSWCTASRVENVCPLMYVVRVGSVGLCCRHVHLCGAVGPTSAGGSGSPTGGYGGPGCGERCGSG